MSSSIELIPVAIEGDVHPRDSLAGLLLAAMQRNRQRLQRGDVLVVKHKIVSKAEGRLVPLDEVKPSARARQWARRTGHDPRLMQVMLRESRRVVRARPGLIITETRHGFICANSGVDVSNVDGGRSALLLPQDSDRSARELRRELRRRTGVDVAVIVADSFGRPWRLGLTEAALGVAGLQPLLDFRGRRDPHGYKLRGTVEAVADELASAAALVCGKLERVPACIIRGFRYQRGSGSGRELLRPRRQDLFR